MSLHLINRKILIGTPAIINLIQLYYTKHFGHKKLSFFFYTKKKPFEKNNVFK